MGAYGVAVEGLTVLGLVECPDAWPTAHLRQEQGEAEHRGWRLTPDEAELSLLGGGVWTLRRDGLRGLLRTPRLLDGDDMAHPGLAGAAVVLAHWLGYEPFHAGAFVAHGGAWGVIGPKEAGKTTLLAHMHLLGMPVVSDDQTIVDTVAGRVMAAPRGLDLRPDAAQKLALETREVRVGERRRLPLDPIAPETALRGWIRLEPGTDVSITKVPPSARPRFLSTARTLPVMPKDPGAFVRLADLPFYELKRPRRWGDASAIAVRLLDAIA